MDGFVRSDTIHKSVSDRIGDFLNYNPDIEPPIRVNPDLKTNSFGPKLINLCKSSGLRILTVDIRTATPLDTRIVVQTDLAL